MAAGKCLHAAQSAAASHKGSVGSRAHTQPLACAQIVSYLPSFFFGSLLLLFGVEITTDWLILSARKVTRKEYGLLLATFAAVIVGVSPAHNAPAEGPALLLCSQAASALQPATAIHHAGRAFSMPAWGCAPHTASVPCAGGLELGIAAGMLMATCSFAYSYARVRTMLSCCLALLDGAPSLNGAPHTGQDVAFGALSAA